MAVKKEKVPWWDRLNFALYPYLGPPKLGPYDQPAPVDPSLKPCPLCGEPMGEHQVDRGEGRPTYLRCPSSSD
jgi:hypothetical protein